jgi:hypothetical protein
MRQKKFSSHRIMRKGVTIFGVTPPDIKTRETYGHLEKCGLPGAILIYTTVNVENLQPTSQVTPKKMSRLGLV